MSTETAVAAPTAVVPLDPASPRGLQVAADLSEVFADVITRLRAQGQPVPDLSADPAP